MSVLAMEVRHEAHLLHEKSISKNGQEQKDYQSKKKCR